MRDKRPFIALAAFAASIVLLVAGCKGGGGASKAAPLSTPAIRQAVEPGKKTVVFFLNPNGGPCRMQNEILAKLQADMGGGFNVAYASSLVQEDSRAFYDYGVRGLPSVVVLNGRGEIATHFPPGIQSYETLQRAIAGAE